jgi:hypothetical protein
MDSILLQSVFLNRGQILALIAPIVLIGSKFYAFRGIVRRFGYPTEYLAAFGIYSSFWPT